MIDYKLKSELIGSDKLKLYKTWSKVIYEFINCPEKEIELEYYQYCCKMLHDFEHLNYSEYKECGRLLHSQYERTTRLKMRIKYMIENYDCLFLTLTFRDDVLNNTSVLTRRQYVRKYLKSLNCLYIANIDFGEKYDREHYHAIITLNDIDYSIWFKKCGAINGLKVRTSQDYTKLSRYINKLTNHAIKETVRQHRVIYGKGFKGLLYYDEDGVIKEL